MALLRCKLVVSWEEVIETRTLYLLANPPKSTRIAALPLPYTPFPGTPLSNT